MNITKDLKKGQRIRHHDRWWIVERVYKSRWSGVPRAVLKRVGVIRFDTDQVYVPDPIKPIKEIAPSKVSSRKKIQHGAPSVKPAKRNA